MKQLKKILFIVSLSRWSQREEKKKKKKLLLTRRSPQECWAHEEAALCCSQWETAYMWSKK